MDVPVKNPRKGFTLIELLVVIAIIAILAAILFPVFAQARSKARQIAGTSNCRQVALAIVQYTQDYDEKFPRTGYGGEVASDGSWINQAGSLDWQNVVAPYIKNTGVYVSPGDASQPTGWAVGDSDWTYPDGQFSLLMNDLLAHTAPTGTDGYADETQQDHHSTGLSLAAVVRPADCILIAEGHGGWNKCSAADGAECTTMPDATGSTDVTNKWHHEHTISGNFTPFLTGKGYDGTVLFGGVPFYQAGGNVAFTDGHVKYVKMTDSQGNPIICGTLPWAKHMDPQARRADDTANYCGGNNPVPGGWTGHNWF